MLVRRRYPIRIASFNYELGVDSPDLLEGIGALDDDDLLHSKEYVTFAFPRLDRVFRAGVLPVMQGLYLQSTYAHGSAERIAPVFGFSELNDFEYDGEPTTCIVPALYTSFLPDLGNPQDAINHYHGRLIQETNAALKAVDASYRLATLAIGNTTA